jgi:hypothetical protein
MQQLQAELDADYPELEIQLLGVNQAGYDAANEQITDGRDLPWLQDTVEVNAWNLWGVGWRDLYVLDGENRVVGNYNLTEHNLSLPPEYDGLKALLLEAAGVVE